MFVRKEKEEDLFSIRRNRMSNSGSDFLSNANYGRVVGFLRQHYARQTGVTAINEKTDTRLQKTVQHYMNEVARAQGTSKPLTGLNQEVVRETTTSMDLWLKKNELVPTGMAQKRGVVRTSQEAVIAAAAASKSLPEFAEKADVNRIFDTMEHRFNTIAAERAAIGGTDRFGAATSSFSLPQDTLEIAEDPVSLMQKIQKQREEEAAALGITTPPVAVPPKLVIREEPPLAAVDPIVPPQPTPPPPSLGLRQQDYIIPQEPVVKYIEKETNIFLSSLDRDWSRDNGENRYNFSIKFNPGNTQLGYGLSPAVHKRFRNIVRIEFVKTVVPTEGLDAVVRNTGTAGSPTYDTTRIYNVFSFPYVAVRIAELNTNGFSTNPDQDNNTFAMVHYDSTWMADNNSNNTNRSAYTSMIPKFLKCQRVYEPTPLGSLQKLSVRLERPSMDLISSSNDAFDLSGVFLSANVPVGITNNSVYNISGNNYIFLQTSTYFLQTAFGEDDRIYIQNVVATGADAANDFTTFINQSTGHVVIGIASNTGGTISDGANAQGYANYVIIRSRFMDPTTGSTARDPFGGAANDTALGNTLKALVQTSARIINANRQVHMVFRIITREMDSASNIRPDNVM
jgi:hypothetical protein